MAGRDDMRAPNASTKLTYEDYLLFPDDGQRHELIDGEHYVSPSPTADHQLLSRALFRRLDAYLSANPLGQVLYAPLDVLLSNFDVVQPDLLFISKERLGILKKWIHGAPDLVIEILSPNTRRTDEVAKRKLFERVDVREYWIVDPDLEIVKIFRRQADGSFPRVAELTREGGDQLTTPLLPGLTIALEEIFREAASWIQRP